jgi:hypothetical protein
MRTFGEWCKFFDDIEKDPKAITPRLTVRDLLAAREHIDQCKDCSDSMDRVLANAPPEKPMGHIGFN